MKRRILSTTLGASVLALPWTQAQAQSVAELQRQINELKAMVHTLKAERKNSGPSHPPRSSTPIAHRESGSSLKADKTVQTASAAPAEAPRPKPWYEQMSLRGYTQLRGNEFLSGDRTAPNGFSRLRSVHDGGITDKNNFTFRRVRLILQGNIHERVFIYLQNDFAVAVGNQTSGEQRQHYTQLRDAYADVFLDEERSAKIRFGQQKVPYGWENLQSSQNRLTLDRSDAINSAVPGERDIGMTAYYTPPHVQRIWDRLQKGGQKLFGNYGAFGVGIYNGQTINRIEKSNDLMTVAMATWPFELDGFGEMWRGQVLELGGSAYRNEFQPEIRAGGVSARSFEDQRVGVHAILYPQPFGLQGEWNWGTGPEWDPVRQAIESKPLGGGYVQAMYKVDDSFVGPFMPYARWQTYRGGWKVGVNAPRLETDEFELGIEFIPIKPVELTLAYARMKRREADERRMGQAEGDLFRAQLQINY